MRRVPWLLLLWACSCTRGPAAPSQPPEPTPPTTTPAEPTPVATAEAEPEPVAAPEEPSPGLPPPSEAELSAWDRKDPAGDAKLIAFDTQNLDRMLGYWNDLACFRGRVVAEGQLAFGSEPGSPADERFFQFKRQHTVALDAWQQSFFAKEPRILEKSKFVGHFLEAHEIAMFGYPKAFGSGDPNEVKEVESWWVVVEAKTKKYAESLGGTWKAPVCDAATPKAKPKKKTK
jgi:hypothetical protein